jgi:hypothetical protein
MIAVLTNHMALASMNGLPPSAEMLDWELLVLVAIFSGPPIAIGGLVAQAAMRLLRRYGQAFSWYKLALVGLPTGAVWATLVSTVLFSAEPMLVFVLTIGGALAGALCGSTWWLLVERHRASADV